MNADALKLWYTSPAKDWTDALPIGNGRIGAMVYGGVDEEKICLNEDTLWSGYPRDQHLEDAAHYYKVAQELALEKKYPEAQEILEAHCLGKWSQAYLPLGDIHMSFTHIGEVTQYRRELDLEKALTTTTYKVGEIAYQREILVSAPHDVMVIKCSANEVGKVSFKLAFDSQLRVNQYVENNQIVIEGECPSHVEPNYVQSENPVIYSDKDEERGIGFKGKMAIKLRGGSLQTEGSTLIVQGADEAVIYFGVHTSFNGFDKLPFLEGKEYKVVCDEQIAQIQSVAYSEIKVRHLSDYAQYFNRVTLDLGSSHKENMPTDERLRAFEKDKDDLALYSLLFNFGRYLIISASRKGTQPTNLQGIWNKDLRAAWSSNYTVNINTEMNYWPVLMCNLVEFNEPLVQMVKELRVTGEETAKRHYGARGFTAHHNVDLWRHSIAVGDKGKGAAVYGFWPMSAAWLCRHLFEHYEYTMDETYLREEAYPIMKAAALFCSDLLVENEEGYLMACPSTSPENSFRVDGKYCSVAGTSTMTMSLIKDVFNNCIYTCELLGMDEEFKAELQATLPQLFPYQIGSKGQLLEWNEEFEEVEIEHRHISHLYALHPGNEISVDKTPELAEACKQSLLIRGDDGTGWSLGWKVNQWARLRDGEHTLKLIDRQLRVVETDGYNYTSGGGTYINMFDAHPPFQIDGNYGVTAGIAEMFMQSTREQIVVLPAIPEKWARGEVKGLLAKGNITVDIKWENHELTKLVLESKTTQTINVAYKDQVVRIRLEAHQATEVNMN